MANFEFDTMSGGALKHLKGKLPLELIPPESLEAYAKVLEYGCSKYAKRNWEKGIPLDVILGSLKRHTLRLEKGELLDEESKLPHAFHMHFWTGALTKFLIDGKIDLLDEYVSPPDVAYFFRDWHGYYPLWALNEYSGIEKDEDFRDPSIEGIPY